MKNGWHVINGWKVYVEDGRILRGIIGEGNNQTAAIPYRASRSGGWDSCGGLTVEAFRAGTKRRTIILA